MYPIKLLDRRRRRDLGLAVVVVVVMDFILLSAIVISNIS